MSVNLKLHCGTEETAILDGDGTAAGYKPGAEKKTLISPYLQIKNGSI